MGLKPTHLLLLLLISAAASPASSQPVNDNFSNRTPITRNNGKIFGTLAGATAESGEPQLPEISSGQSAWWTWTAPANGILSIAVSATNFNPLVTIFTGNQLSNLALVASNNYLVCYSDVYCGCHWRTRDQLTLHVTKGQAYQISVDSPIFTDATLVQGTNYYDWSPAFSTNVAPGTNVELVLTFHSAPANDNFNRAVRITGSRVRVNVNNNGASKEPGEPDVPGNPGGSSVWYVWTAPATGRVTLSTNEIPVYAPPSWGGLGLSSFSLSGFGNFPPTCGTAVDQNPPPEFFPVLSAYTGTSVNSLTSTGFLPMDLVFYDYGVEFDVTRGQTYHISCDGNLGTTAPVILSLALTTPASNDKFARRIRMQGSYVAASGFNAGAQPEAGAPNIGNGSTGKLAWWSWTSPVDGSISMDMSLSDYSFPIAVYTGTSLSNLTLVEAGVQGFAFNAQTGQTYQIAVGDAAGLTGEIKIVIQAPQVPATLIEAVTAPPLKSALLRYQAVTGQVLQLQRLGNDSNWKNLQRATAHHGEVDFHVNPAPGTNGPAYQAIVVNYVPQ
jgi:hypothetical protein